MSYSETLAGDLLPGDVIDHPDHAYRVRVTYITEPEAGRLRIQTATMGGRPLSPITVGRGRVLTGHRR